MKNNTVAIAFICDNGYVIPTLTAIHSLMSNKREVTIYKIYVVTSELSESNIKLFEGHIKENIEISVIPANIDKIKGIHIQEKNSHCVATEAALLKFYLPELIDEEKILYLDGDILVQRDLLDLYNENIECYYAGVVIDSGSIYYKHDYVKKVENYFNSGVMLLNLKLLRNEQISHILLQTKKDLKDSSLMDQNVFNIVFDKKVKLLPIKYNVLLVNLDRAQSKYNISDINQQYCTQYDNLQEIVDDAYILHFSSKDKPWKYSNVIGANEWYKYYLRSNLSGDLMRKMLDEDINKILVSVIIPVYNVEKYIEETLISVLSQTLSEIEIICINDGSKDRSGEIIRKYAKKDKRVIFLEQENQGQSVARNKGIELAKGEYLYFLDSDDLIETNALEILYNKSKKENLDLLLFDGCSFFENARLKCEHKNYETYYQM